MIQAHGFQYSQFGSYAILLDKWIDTENISRDYGIVIMNSIVGIEYDNVDAKYESGFEWVSSEAKEKKLIHTFLAPADTIDPFLRYDTRNEYIVNRGRVLCDSVDELRFEEDGVFVNVTSVGADDADGEQKNGAANDNNGGGGADNEQDNSGGGNENKYDNADDLAEIDKLINKNVVWDVNKDKTELTNLVLVDPICGMVEYPIMRDDNARIAEVITQRNGKKVEVEMHKQCVKAMGRQGLKQVMTDIYNNDVAKFGNYLYVNVAADGKVTHQLKRASRMRTDEINLSSFIQR